MTAFSTPVPGIIRPPGSPLIVGSFRVTCDFVCHESRTPPVHGIDVGDGTTGKPVLAMSPGRISLVVPGKVGSTASVDASIVRIKFPNGYEQGAAHLRIRPGLATGQVVPEGYQLGTIDKIGASAAHLHGGMRDPAGHEIDWWPLLRQNGAIDEEDDVNLSGTFLGHLSGTATIVSSIGARFRAGVVSKADAVLDVIPDGAEIHPVIASEGWSAGGPTPLLWIGFWYETSPQKWQFGYTHSSIVSAITPPGIPPAQHDAQVKAARAAGISDAARNAAATT